MTTPTSLSFQCKFIIPESSESLHDVISRWSDTNIEKPAIIVVPESEQDIIQAVRYAQENGLRLLTSGGGHGPYVPVTPKTLYLDMSSFDKINLNEAEKTVTLGGGVITREFIKTCLDKGYYSCWPNSNAVGMVGFVIGLGNVSYVEVQLLSICNKR
jgi:FAD/FMN-containing dehydrogenase